VPKPHGDPNKDARVGAVVAATEGRPDRPVLIITAFEVSPWLAARRPLASRDVLRSAVAAHHRLPSRQSNGREPVGARYLGHVRRPAHGPLASGEQNHPARGHEARPALPALAQSALRLAYCRTSINCPLVSDKRVRGPKEARAFGRQCGGRAAQGAAGGASNMIRTSTIRPLRMVDSLRSGWSALSSGQRLDQHHPDIPIAHSLSVEALRSLGPVRGRVTRRHSPRVGGAPVPVRAWHRDVVTHRGA
jgi:hypothetical protein